ncbi:adhesion G protein-coupled receptor A1 isoform X2 [Xiphias gladius]|uniref:adhesion G protein-coupled receptor A1 isoform X2 n=1 Tax=Xiphias gladius TaxID=8245 RepID=UPI001A98D17E|nr:adhesion G protein-coupled receptor A1 isoform X2 [Xiphias gladius]
MLAGCRLTQLCTFATTGDCANDVIRISRNGWHTLLNFLFHTGLTFGVFAGGINQIKLPFVCQMVGIVLHYASLSTMLWLMFTARDICKDVSKDPLQTQDKNGPAQTHTKPTILRFYLVSDGIPLIIVGVTAAFGMDNYGSRDEALYCWMAWEPSLGGFYAPMTLLVLVMSVYFLCTYIQLKRHPGRKYELQVLSEEQQQLSSSEPKNHCHTNTGGLSGPAGDCPPFATGVSVLANEHSFKSQLRATAFTLFLFLATWALGGLAVSLGHFLDMIFSCLYGAFCVTLGLFLLIQHCAKRDDVWHHWWACCPFKSNTEDGNGSGQSQRQGLHRPHCHLNSPCSGKQQLLSPHLVQSSYHKMTPSPQSSTPIPTGPCCVAVMNPVTTTPISPITEPMPSPCPQSLPDELPRPILPLQSCLTDRTKSRSFNRPRPCLQEYRSHMASTSMDESVHSSHLDSLHAAHHLESSPLVSNSPHPDVQLSCPSPHLDKQMVSCHSLQRQTSCHSVKDSMTSCHSQAHNMHNSISSCNSLLLPSHGVHTCQWHMYSSADHSSTTSCCEKPDPFTLQYLQDPEAYSCMSKTTDKENDNLCLEVEPKGFPRNTLPRQHTTISLRGTIGRNRSLQEDGLFCSDATRNIRTGPWKNETTV